MDDIVRSGLRKALRRGDRDRALTLAVEMGDMELARLLRH